MLFAQTFVHPQLDEYVDEVIFSEPIVITACELLEQSASSASPAVTLLGATSPPSFALEVFVQCEGETRFRRLCQPFLYSHSSSNVLEVEAIVTSHLVVRGSYRSLSLIIYGNTAEDLGQFKIGVDLDSNLTNLVCSTEGKLDDLPPALRSSNLAIEDSISSLKALTLRVAPLDISVETKQFLQLLIKVLELTNLGDAIYNVVSTVVSSASYISRDLPCTTIHQKQFTRGRSSFYEESQHGIIVARKELLDLYRDFYYNSDNISSESLAECTFLESEADLATSKQLMDLLNQYFHFESNFLNVGPNKLSQNKNIILGLSVALLLCSGREGCFHFVNGGGMEQLARVFSHDLQNSTAVTLMLLGVVEQATRHSIGCEGFLGWWPREDENVPSGISEGYSQLLKLLMQKQRHDVAAIATYVLHRLRLYEVATRYECAVLSVLGGLSAVGKVTSVTLDMLISVKSQLKFFLKLINARGPIEDPSPVACASRSLILGHMEGLLSYKATSGLIASSNCCFSTSDIDSHLLSLLKERGFLPLSAALLSSTILRSEVGHSMDIFADIASLVEGIILSLLFCRPGLIFLLNHSELSATLILALRGVDDMNKEDCVPLRYASVLISKGFFCRPSEVGMIVEMHLRVVYAIDRLLTSSPQSEEFLWVLWELCGLSRSDCGRQAVLAIGYFPEAISVLTEALHSVKELEPAAMTSGTSPLNIAIFHSVAEIFEVLVTDSTASSLASWIEHAMEIYRALHSSSPGSNRKDAPTRLLEWIDAGVVYHKNGAVGLLQYIAILASGEDAHLGLTSVLVSDPMDVENAVGDSSSGSDVHVMENLAKLISEKSFGLTLKDPSVTQLTTAFRILAFISENPAVAATLYDEGAITVVCAVLLNCGFMLEKSSNNYDYLVDEGTECNSTSELLLERNREQSLVDLLIPSLVLLITLLQKLREAKEEHRNTKLMNALLRLHREVSPKLAACAADLSSPCPDSALGFGAVCHLLVSALACWPTYGWTPGLFHSLLANVQATSLLAFGPKETCSLLCLLNDLFPEEGIWLWKNGMPLLSALRTLAVGTLLGPQKEKQVDWYLQPGYLKILLNQLTPQLEKIAQIILHYSVSALVVIQDMLRVFIIRIACQKVDHASVLLRPIFLWIRDCLSDSSSLSDTDTYKVYRLLNFLASLLEHPRAKPLLLKEGAIQMLIKVLQSCSGTVISDEKQLPESRNLSTRGFTQLSWCLPVFKSVLLIFDSRTSLHYPGRSNKHNFESFIEDCTLVFPHIFRLCQVLPVGKELLACLTTFKELGSRSVGQSALMVIFSRVCSSTSEELESERGYDRDGNCNLSTKLEWRKRPPLLCCWKKLLRSVDSKDVISSYAIEAVGALSLGALLFSIDDNILNLNRVAALKCLFGLPYDMGLTDGFPEENIKFIIEMTTLLTSMIRNDDYSTTSNMKSTLYQVLEYTKSFLSLMENPIGSVLVKDIISPEVLVSSKLHQTTDGSVEKFDEFLQLGLRDKFLWECPETLPDRLSQTTPSLKRKTPTLEGGTSRRARGDNPPAEIMVQNTFSRGPGLPITPSAPTRRDTFRQRKPNTSRPPSMHVDDYVARERSVDGNVSSNVIAVQRVGPSGGRAPSIHVDEFIARQKERQNSIASVSGENTAQEKNVTPENDTVTEKSNKSSRLKADLDDDLQGIDIVFDGEESESDDKLPFPQPDDTLQQPAPVIMDQNSPHSIVEETESDVNESSQFSHLSTPLASNLDENSQSEFSSSRPLVREQSVNSEKKYDPSVKTSSGFDPSVSASSSGFPSSLYNKQLSSTSSMPPPNFYSKQSSVQPPLPPMPPPQAVISQGPDHVPTQSSPYLSGFNNTTVSMSRTSITSPSGSVRPSPPLPSTPPPFIKPSTSQPYNQPSGSRLNSYPLPPMMPNMAFNRPPGSIQLQPLQPPQVPRPAPQPPQHIRPPNQEHGVSVQLQQVQILQQPQHVYYQTVQESYSTPHVQQQQQQQEVEVMNQQEQPQDPSGMSLQHFFSSPEAIQSLLGDRDKLCQLLEQHPKLMQMLQERLGHL